MKELKWNIVAVSCLALLAGPAMAQSNVTVYGVADAFIGYGKTDDSTFTGVGNGGWSGSRLGFKGSEDLGNGLKAVFTLEQGFNIDNGTSQIAGSQFSRQSWVGLEGPFGFVGVGRQHSPGFFAFAFDAADASSLSPQFLLALAARANIVTAGAARISNSINYKSPDMGGLKLNAIYGFNEVNQTGNLRKNDLFALGATYANGPMVAGATYSQVNDAASEENKQEWLVGGAYDFGVFRLLGSYQRVKNATIAEDTDNVWQIGGVVPLGAAGRVHVAYGSLDADANDSDADAWTLMYTHQLSKRTMVYAGYGQIANDDMRDISALALGSAGETSRNLMLGMRHGF